MTNSDRLQEIRERADKATPPPWIAPSWENDDEPILMPLIMPAWKPHTKTEDGEEYECEGCDECLDAEGRSADTYFVASAREDIPWLLQLITEQQNEIAWLRTWIFRLHDPEIAAQKIHELTEEPMTIEQIRTYLGIKP